MRTHVMHLVVGILLLGTSVLAVPASSVLAADQSFGAFLYKTSCAKLSQDKVLADFGELGKEGRDAHWWDSIFRDANDPGRIDMVTEEKELNPGTPEPGVFYGVDHHSDTLTIDSLTAGDYAIAIHKTDSADAPVVACGDITGTVDNGTLLIELNEVKDSGFNGRAFFAPLNDAKNAGLEMAVGVWPVGEVEPLSTPISTPAS